VNAGLSVVVVPERCVGAGQCVLAAPEVFDQHDEDGVVLLLDPRPPASRYDGVRLAAQVCPAAAIHLTDLTAEPQGRNP
jgi:ferredoxin